MIANRPANPPPEWWLLLDLAADADDITRLTACGFEYMERRTQASRPTIYRWLKKLHDGGMVKTVSRSKSGGRGGSKGQRAVYEIQVPPRFAARIGAQLASGPERVIRSHGGRRDSGGADANQVSQLVRPDCRLSATLEPRKVIQVSPAVRPSIEDPVRPGPVEGARRQSGQKRITEEKNRNPRAA